MECVRLAEFRRSGRSKATSPLLAAESTRRDSLCRSTIYVDDLSRSAAERCRAAESAKHPIRRSQSSGNKRTARAALASTFRT